MSAEAWAIAGIIVSILVGIPALFIAKKVRTSRQSQKIGRSGTGLQAGRDIRLDGEE